eukprot:4126155-Pyramimonas_sp.AAC.1
MDLCPQAPPTPATLIATLVRSCSPDSDGLSADEVRTRSPGSGCSSSPSAQASRVNCEDLSRTPLVSATCEVRTPSPGGGCSSSPSLQASRVNCEGQNAKSWARVLLEPTATGSSMLRGRNCVPCGVYCGELVSSWLGMGDDSDSALVGDPVCYSAELCVL